MQTLKAPLSWLAISCVIAGFSANGLNRARAGDLAKKFALPPAKAKPWVYWFWKNGNISREGITADLEAMQKVGIGGVILMEVALTVPPGEVTFFSARWRELFKHAVSEASRLGLVVSMNSAPGWTGSGGPWVKAEQSMQKVVASEIKVSGPRGFAEALPQPETLHGFYRDIAVLAFPTPEKNYRIADIKEKALYERGPISSRPGVRAAFYPRTVYERLPPGQVIGADQIVDLSARMDAGGRLTWDVPQGRWTLLRFGHTSTGQTNRPAPLPGLECDKLDTKALDAHFRSFTAKLLNDVGPLAGKTLVATHLDSWEVGAQNWTARFREAFQKRRGYDLLGYLPVVTGRVVESLEVSERFLWDLRRTVSEMIVENHGRHLHALAQEHGLWLSIEPYDMTPCDDMTLGATADVPMCEFWSKGFDTRYSVKEATSIAHVYGKPVVAAEAFTSGPADAWRLHPASIKALGDWAFCEGVNRFVIHRYIHQPFMQIRPGLSLGPHGLHYERTQTWWSFSRPWHEYLARCQHVLRQGRFVADVLYLSPEGAPNVFQRPSPEPAGYKYDACTPEALLTRVAVRDGRLVLPDGMGYRLLVLPETARMTPELLAKIKALVEAGATVVGVPPCRSPSLSGYPRCDVEIKQLAEALWPAGPPSEKATEHYVGKGRVIRYPTASDRHPVEAMDDHVRHARWIWHDEGKPASSAPVGKRYFRRALTLKATTSIRSARVAMTADNTFTLYINGRKAAGGDDYHRLYAKDVKSLLRPGENTLAVVAENGADHPNPAGLIGTLVVQYDDGQQLVVHTDRRWMTAARRSARWTTQAVSGRWRAALELGPLGMAPWGNVRATAPSRDVYPDAKHVTAILRHMGVPPDFAADAPLRYAHRRLGQTDVYFVSNGESQPVAAACVFRVTGKRPALWHPETGRKRPLPHYSTTPDGRTTVPLRFEPAESFFVVFDSPGPDAVGEAVQTSDGANFPTLRPAIEISGSWKVRFDPNRGGPKDTLSWRELADWSQRPEDLIRYYSGVASYARTVDIPAELTGQGRRLFLDLGRVEVMAAVTLNGRDLGILWKPPFRVEITHAARPGPNALEVKVVNLWPNRMIGDEHLPPDSARHPNGTLKEWPQWLNEGKPSPTGRHTFTSWRLWKKGQPPLESGLLGPVNLQSSTILKPGTTMDRQGKGRSREKKLPLDGHVFEVDGHTAFVILPERRNQAGPTPWVWYAPTLPGYPEDRERWMFERFLAAGMAVAGVDVGESYGSPKGRAVYSSLYRELLENHRLARKACLLVRSRGGLMLYTWASENAEAVACIAGIYPVCNLRSYPGLAKACGAYGLSEAELTAQLGRHNPIDRLAPLAKANVPIFHIHGDVDTTVPLEDNSGELARRYRQLGGNAQLVVPKGQGHNYWTGFFQCQALVDFIIANKAK